MTGAYLYRHHPKLKTRTLKPETRNSLPTPQRTRYQTERSRSGRNVHAGACVDNEPQRKRDESHTSLRLPVAFHELRNGGLPNMKRLVVVESPTKARTIRNFLPRDGYQIEASMGHIRDLPASAKEIPSDVKGEDWARLGVKVNEGFEPLYVIPSRKKDVVKQLRDALVDADELFIATDEDREGESIGWHLVEVLNPKVPVRRMVFHEITEEAIQRALGETRDIDVDLVEAQETRRILDRLVGYTISPLLWRKIKPKLSAGRVQSVAVRVLVLRERERVTFVPSEYWDLKAQMAKASLGFDAEMTHLGGVRLASGRDFDPDTGRLKDGVTEGEDVLLMDEIQATALAEQLPSEVWRVADVKSGRARNRLPLRSSRPRFSKRRIASWVCPPAVR